MEREKIEWGMKNEDEKKLMDDFVTRIVFLSEILIHFLTCRSCIKITKNSEGLYKNYRIFHTI